jgi:hypothetical protein
MTEVEKLDDSGKIVSAYQGGYVSKLHERLKNLIGT